MSPPPIYRGGAAKFLVGNPVGCMGPAGWVRSVPASRHLAVTTHRANQPLRCEGRDARRHHIVLATMPTTLKYD
ncbi:hypothetical protein ACLOJK_034435 [Asimina triloba]